MDIKTALPVPTRNEAWKGELPIPVAGVPHDSAGYIQSFSKDDAKSYQQFYRQYGFVVIHEVLSSADCSLTVDEIWSVLGKMGGFKRDDSKTWSNGWSKTGIECEGMIGHGAIFAPMAVKNRANPAMLSVAQTLLNESKLLVSHDRYGVFRPAKSDPAFATGANLHLDMNPWRPVGDGITKQLLGDLTYTHPKGGDFLAENNLPLQLPALQMLVNLEDNRFDDGGLQLVPFTNGQSYVAKWASKHRKSLLGGEESDGPYGLEDNFIRLDDDDAMHKRAIRVTARAGSLIMWDKRVIHGSRPNKSDRFRYAQFFLFFPKRSVDPTRMKKRSTAVAKGLKSAGIDTTTLPASTKSLLGLDV